MRQKTQGLRVSPDRQSPRRLNGVGGSGSDALSAFFLLLPYGLLFSIFIAIPVAMAIGLSLSHFNVVEAPRYAGLFNYIMMLTQEDRKSVV